MRQSEMRLLGPVRAFVHDEGYRSTDGTCGMLRYPSPLVKMTEHRTCYCCSTRSWGEGESIEALCISHEIQVCQ